MVRFDRGNALRWGLGALAFMAAIAMWLVPLLMATMGSGKPEHSAYLHDILFTQTAVRYANPWHHLEPYWYFIEVIGLFWLPFSLSFPWLWKPWAMAWRERDARVWLPLAWALLVLVLFSCSAGKRDMYILPALPAFALAAAPFLQGISERLGFRRALWAFLLLLGTVLAVWGWTELFSPTEFATSLARQRGIGSAARWFWGMFAVVGSGVLLVVLWRGPRGALGASAFSLALLWCGYGFVAHPVLDASSSARGLMQQARTRAGSDVELGLVAWKEQNLLQSVGPTVEFGFRRPVAAQMALATAWLRASPGQRLLMVQRGNAGLSCVDFNARGAIPLAWANRRDWWLLSDQAIVRCVASP